MALATEEPTLVVSPLISLMKDQLEKLLEAGIPAALLNSSLSASEEKQALDAVTEGECRILFVTPERLIKEDFIAMLDARDKAKVALVVVDEANCISEWGHDFRPAFVEMLHSIKALGRPPILALTATATPAVMTDIFHQLGMDNAAWSTPAYIAPTCASRSNNLLICRKSANVSSIRSRNEKARASYIARRLRNATRFTRRSWTQASMLNATTVRAAGPSSCRHAVRINLRTNVCGKPRNTTRRWPRMTETYSNE